MISGKTQLPSKHKENECGSCLIKIKGNELPCEVIETKNKKYGNIRSNTFYNRGKNNY